MSRFVGVPSVPLSEDQNLVRILLALKENVELLTDQRGEPDKASVALTAEIVDVPLAEAKFQAFTARGASVYVDTNTAVPMASDYVKLLQDFQLLAADVAALRAVVNLLITRLRAN